MWCSIVVDGLLSSFHISDHGKKASKWINLMRTHRGCTTQWRGRQAFETNKSDISGASENQPIDRSNAVPMRNLLFNAQMMKHITTNHQSNSPYSNRRCSTDSRGCLFGGKFSSVVINQETGIIVTTRTDLDWCAKLEVGLHCRSPEVTNPLI